METPAHCSHCNQETYLFVGDLPICLKCDNARETVATSLYREPADPARKLARVEKTATPLRTAQAS